MTSHVQLPVSIAILAGGQSRRMGQDKAMLEFGGQTLLQRTITLARNMSGDVLVAGRDVPGLRCVSDAVPDAGPLGGLIAGLQAARHEWTLALACDLPLLDSQILSLLISAIAPDIDAAAPMVNGTVQPVCALYHRSILPLLHERAAAGRYSLRPIFAKVRTRLLGEDALGPAGVRALQGVNTPEEWARLTAGRGRISPSLPPA